MTIGLNTEVELPSNPLDIAEEMIAANEWPLDRMSDDELVAETSGRWCDFRLFFLWRHDVSALHFTCTLDIKVPGTRRREVHDLLALINERLWIGHFDIGSEEGLLMYRHTIPLRGSRYGASVEQLEDLVEAAFQDCDRFFPAFQYVIWGGKSAREAIEAALFETVGEA